MSQPGKRRFTMEGAVARYRVSKHHPPEPMWLLRYSFVLGLLAIVLVVTKIRLLG